MFFCVYPIYFTALKIFFPTCPLLLEATFGYLLVYFCIFLYFLRTVCFLVKFCTDIIENILLVYRLKTCMGVLSFNWGYFDFFLREGGTGGGSGVVFWGFFLFKNFAYIFAITQTITKKNIVCCLRLARPF